MSWRTDRAALLLGVTLVIGAILRIVGLQSSLWYDEIVTLVESARHPVLQIVTDPPGLNAHPLYSLLAHASLVTFGDSAWALRLPACVFGIATLVMVYVLGRRLTSPIEAWAGSALLALSYHHVWFSQNARGYTLLGFLTLLSTWLLLRALREGRASDYLLYALACAAGMYTHLTMMFVIAGHVAVILIGQLRRWPEIKRQPVSRLWYAWIGVALLSMVLYAPFVPSLLALMGKSAPHAAAKVATAGWAASEAVRSLLSDAGIWAVALTGLLALIGAISLAGREPLAMALLLMPGVVTGLGMIATRQPIRPRFFFFLAGSAAICMGRGIGVLVERRRAPEWAVGAITVPLLLLSLVALPRNYQVPKQDFDAADADLTSREAQGARVVMAGPACLPFTEYYDKSWRCLRNDEEWTRLVAETSASTLMVYTLIDYVEDSELQHHLRTQCSIVKRFDATLRGGEIVICQPDPSRVVTR